MQTVIGACGMTAAALFGRVVTFRLSETEPPELSGGHLLILFCNQGLVCKNKTPLTESGSTGCHKVRNSG